MGLKIVMTRWILNICNTDTRHTEPVAPTSIFSQGRGIGSELLRWRISLPVHAALDVTRIQLDPPSTVFHTSFLLLLPYNPPITNTDPSDSTTLV